MSDTTVPFLIDCDPSHPMLARRFGRLTVIRRAGKQNRFIMWECRCDCGRSRVVQGIHLRSGHTRSCGCLSRDISRTTNKTHGLSHTREYHTWQHILDRCLNPRNKSWKYYGGRGIRVCERWRNSFRAFFADMGVKPTNGRYSIERINNDGNYTPRNCKWATQSEQVSNRRRLSE